VWFFRIFVAGVLFLYGGAVLPVEYRMGKVKFVFLSEECGRGFGRREVSFDENTAFTRENLLFLMNSFKNNLFQEEGVEAILGVESIFPVLRDSIVYINPVIRVTIKGVVKVDSFIIEGVEKALEMRLKKELEFFRGKVFNKVLQEKIKKTISSYSFLRMEREPVVVKSVDGRNCLYVKVREESVNEFSGIVGYVPYKKRGGGYFTGTFRMFVVNLLGVGGNVRVNWSRIDENSQEFELLYSQVWFFYGRLFSEVYFKQTLRDTLYVFKNFRLTFGKDFSDVYVWLIVGWGTGIPTLAGRTLLGIKNVYENRFGGGLSVDSRNRKDNPTSGFYGVLNFVLNKKKRMNGGKLSYVIESTWDFNRYMGKGLVFNLHGLLKKRWVNSRDFMYTDFYWIGGARDLRGYPEDFFKGVEIGSISVECRKILGYYSRGYIFADLGYIVDIVDGKEKKIYPFSYGLGMKLKTRVGVIGLAYALGKDDTFSTAKVHLTLENRF